MKQTLTTVAVVEILVFTVLLVAWGASNALAVLTDFIFGSAIAVFVVALLTAVLGIFLSREDAEWISLMKQKKE